MRTLIAALAFLALSGCTPKVVRFERFQLLAGQQKDVLWVFIDERLHRCEQLPRGPVCVPVKTIRNQANDDELLYAPAASQPMTGAKEIQPAKDR